MRELYEKYTCEDFMQDDDFKLWLSGHDLENDCRWRVWFEANPNAKREADKATAILLSLNFKEIHVEPQALDEQWDLLKKSLTHSEQSSYAIANTWWKPHFAFIKLISAASVILICFFLGRVFLQPVQPTTATNTIIRTNSGQQLDIRLADGTEVKLNAGSTLIYPPKFSGKFRNVELVGEAFFKVTKNDKMPFIIKAGEIITKVVGTEFNINAYPENKEVQVAVVEGKVAVKTEGQLGATNQSVCLTKEEMVTFGKEDKDLVVSKFDAKEQVGWKDGILYFEKCDFSTALKKMERWYGVTIQISSGKPELNDLTWRFSGKFQGKSLPYVLEAMSYPNRFSFKIENNVVNLNPR